MTATPAAVQPPVVEIRANARRLLGLALAGAVLMIAGVALSPWIPINKKI